MAILGSNFMTILVVAGCSFMACGDSLTVNVASGVERDLDASEKAAVTGNTVAEVIKTGEGSLAPASSASFAGFKGTVRVQAGRLVLQGSNWIPTSAKISVEGDATGGGSLVLHGTGAMYNTDTPIEFAGTGVDGGIGAIVVDGFASGDMNLNNTVMTGDALVVVTNTTRAVRFQGSKGLDMNGHTLTLRPHKTPEQVV